MESQIRMFGLLMVFAVTIYAFHRSREMTALVFMALAPLKYFSQNVGILLSPAKLMGLLFLVYIIFNPRCLTLLKNKYLGAFLPFYLYTIYLTFIMANFWPDYSVAQQSFLYGNAMRSIVQIFLSIMGLAIVIVMMNGLTSAHSLFKAQVTLLLSMVFLSIFGLYVWFAQRVGLPFPPIYRGHGETQLGRVIHATIDGVRMMRAYSLSGEPKTLASNVCLGVVLTYFTPASQIRYLKGLKGEIVLISLFFVTLYFTLSTAGYLVLPMVVLTAIAVQVRIGRVAQDVVMRFVAMAIILVPVSYFSGYDISGRLSAVYETRVESRIGEEGMFTYAETAMVKFWADQPVFAITGVGLGGSSFYIREYDTESYGGFTAAPRGIIGFISDKGIIGLFLFLYGLYKTSRPLILVAASNSPNRLVYSGVLVICLVTTVLIFTSGSWRDEWIVVALACAGATIAQREINMARAHARAANLVPSR